ncbi:signal-induced proliferation-associated 1-like protein 1 isoform X2 [Ostrea edulis]|uniref:signal-induced proliferation-associated 1-like protein 1 isoform X2 n=1 Tax=Ostrea edulis TaxID=37623 RepID=UPI0024AEF556|nr:signal-induced proliferation-associated 1-like protein 1 isoform X2 [Ostrea edulis]
MANSERVPLETIRKRSERAVEYYKNCVVPAYHGRGNAGSPMITQGHDSMENMNGIYTSQNGNTDQDPRGTKGGVTFQDSSGSSNSTVKHNDSFTRGGHRATFHGTHSSKWKSGKSRSKEKSKSPESDSKSKKTSQGLSRSNSNLEMDSIDFDDAADFHNSSMRRDYGSTSSLDVLSTSGDASFFAMIKDFGHRNLDQRSPAPAQMQEFLRGRIDSNKERIGGRGDKFSNGSTTPDRGGVDDVDGSPRSKSMKMKSGKERKTRSKSITNDSRTGNILNKFRGKQEVEIGTKMTDSINSEIKAEERLRKKAFVHYDCQSLGFDIQSVINKKSNSNVSKNTSTGASAASGQVRSSMAGERDAPDISTDTDDGDGKSNALVQSCPFFRNELGGEEERTISAGRNVAGKSSNRNNNISPGTSAITSTRSPACCGLSILDSLPTPTGLILAHVVLHRGHVIEYVDHGSSYYRHFFYGYEHQNYYGIDDAVGPVAISIRKEKVDDRENNLGRADYGSNQFRVIVRTSELTTLRGVILEEAIPTSASRLGGSRTTTVKDVIEYICPDLQSSCLKLASSSQKSLDQLLKVDQQGVNQTYKVGIMYCKAGQSSEEDMYNNEHSGPAFEEFLSCIGQKVRLKGFEKYRAQLDNKTDSTGQQSVYTTFNNCEMMFHVSTMLPYTPNNTQQLLRKRHIGNDIVTIVFQEPGALPFTPKTVRSQFQHVFIIVRVHNPCTDNVHYSIAVTRSKDVPPFGPHIPENAMFTRSDQFAEFLLAKVINAENAAHRCEKFIAMATRTRTEYLKDLAQNHVTTTTLDSGSKLSKFSLGSGRKKDKVKQKVVPDIYASGAIIWNVQVEDFGSGSQTDAVLAISSEVLVIQEESSKSVIFTVHCGAIIGWTAQANSIKIYFNQEESILIRPLSGEMEETEEICIRLKAVTPGCPTEEKTLKRNGLGQLGFHINADAIVTDVENNSFAHEVGLLKGSRLVEICKVASTNLSHEDMVDLLRTSQTVKVTLISPMADGTPRGVTTLLTNCRYTSLNTLKAACKATQNVQQRQKEALMGQKSVPLNFLNGSHHSLCKTSSDSSEYAHQRHQTDLNISTEMLSMEFLRTEFASIFSGSNENLYSPDEQPSQLSSSSSEQSFHLRDSLTSNSSLRLDIRDSRLSSSSSEFATSPTQKEPPSAESPSQRGSQTLPHHRKPSAPTRGDRHSPVKNLLPGYRPITTSSLQRGAGLHHAFTDSSLFTKTGGPYDEGYSSRHTDTLRSEDGKHERSGSRDSGDYQYLSGAPRPWTSTRTTYNQIRRQDPANSSGDSGSYGSSIHGSDSVPSGMSSLQSSNFSRKYSAPGGDYSAVQHGNISLELMKQTQNSKYLLSQGQEGTVRSTNSSVNLSDTSFSSGSSHNSGALPGQRGYSDPSYHSNSSRDDLTNVGKKRADPTSTNSKGRPGGHRRTHLSEISPLSSENGSPRSSQRNLSGMSSEESLNTRLRPGVHGKHSKTQSNELQEDLKRLIDMDIKNSDLRGILNTSTERPSFYLKRTMSDESLHSQKGATISPTRDAMVADLIFSTAPPVPALPKEVLGDARLSPRAMLDSAMAAKARQVLSRNAAASQPKTQQNPVPLPESAASLDWSNLVNVATKAIESTDGSKSQNSSVRDPKDRALPPEPVKPMGSKPNTSCTKPPTSQTQGSSVWRSTVSNPQQRIQELEAKVEQLEVDLDKERKENADLEVEVQSLRRDNIRLQEESQTAAAQLRKFTEWFFQTIDRQ